MINNISLLFKSARDTGCFENVKVDAYLCNKANLRMYIIYIVTVKVGTGLSSTASAFDPKTWFQMRIVCALCTSLLL